MVQIYIIGLILFLSLIIVIKEIVSIYLAVTRKRVISKRHLQEHLLILIAFMAFIVAQHAIIFISFNTSVLVWLVEERNIASVLVTVYLLYFSFVSLFVRHLKKEREVGELGFITKIEITKVKEY